MIRNGARLAIRMALSGALPGCAAILTIEEGKLDETMGRDASVVGDSSVGERNDAGGPSGGDASPGTDGGCSRACSANEICEQGACVAVCAVGVTVGDAFTSKMSGCAGAVTHAARATLCPAGAAVCSAAQWVARRADKTPTFDYWVEDALRYTGSKTACSVSATAGTVCTAGRPMRVCTPGGTPPGTDALGNTCAWVQCGYEAITPTQHFGGCSSNATAGVLCCKP